MSRLKFLEADHVEKMEEREEVTGDECHHDKPKWSDHKASIIEPTPEGKDLIVVVGMIWLSSE